MSRKVLSEENSFTNANGQKIFTKYWKPIGEKARALIFIAHGFGQHCSRYETLGTALAEEGFLAFSHDHIGHGRSEGERVQIQDFSLYVRDVFTHIDQVAAENTRLPIFMFGHSMGGPITILSIFKRPSFFAGAIFSAPAMKSDPNKPSRLMVFLGRIVAYIAPSYQLLPPTDPSLLTRNPVEAEKYANDPLIWHGGIKAKWTAQILAVMGEIRKDVSNITIPYLLLHGDDDRVCLIDGSHFLHDNSPSTDKTFKVYKDGRHELLNETKETADQVLQDILDWLKRKVA